jgi:hypothetical protein
VPLSQDQRALLRLLAQREEGYEDIAALMGIGVEEVRGRVREALAELERPPEASRVLYGEPPRAAREKPPKPDAARPQRPLRMPENRRLLGALAGGAVVVVLLILLVTGAFGGGGGGSSPNEATPEGTAEGPAKTTASSPRLTEAKLTAVDGSDASGRALFGRYKNQPLLQVQAEGLEPSPPGSSYTVWLYHSPQVALRVGAVKVGKSGGIGVQLPVPTEVLAYVASGGFDQIAVSLTRDSEYKAEVAKAKREKKLPPYTGTDILRGKISGPIVKAASQGSG